MTVRQSRHGAATAPSLAYHNDDGRRADAGVPGTGDDHVVRAIAIVTGEDYLAVRRAVAKAMGEHGYTLTGKESARWMGGIRPRPRLARRSAEESVLRQFGFERVYMPPRSRRPSLSEAHIAHDDCIVGITGRRKAMARYMCALVDGALRDVRDVRTYRWRGAATGDGHRPVEVRERKALVIWVRSNPTHPIQ